MNCRTQKYGNSCGAASLLCAALDAGMNKPPAVHGNTDVAEESLYLYTSGQRKNIKKLKDPEQWGYSLPSGICTAAKTVGFNQVDAYIDSGSLIAQGILGIYSNEVADTQTAGGTVTNTTYDWENAKDRCLVLVAWDPAPTNGLHWVYAYGGQVMDPGSGSLWTSQQFKSNVLSGKGVVVGIFLTFQ